MLKNKIKNASISMVFFIFVVLAWQLFISVYDSVLIPSTMGTVRAAFELLLEARTWEAFWISNQSLALGFGVSAVVGITLGFLIGRVAKLERIIDPWLDFLLVLPLAMILPVVIMSIGFSLLSRVLIVCLFAIPVIIINTRAGLRQVSPELIDMARVFGANEYNLWKKILIKGSAPMIWVGLRSGLGRAISGMVLSELLLIAVGIGMLFQIFQGNFDPERTFGLVALLVIESLLLLKLLSYVERRAIPWFYIKKI